MFTEEEEKKKKTNYGSIFVYCFFCVVLVVGLVRFAKPYDNLKQNLIEETAAVVEEGFFDVKNSGTPPCQSSRSRSGSGNHEKLSAPAWIYRELPPTSYCVKFDSFATMLKQVKDGKYESRPFSVGGHNWSLLIYPNGNKQDRAPAGYISAYVRIHNSSLMTNGVYAEIKFFVYNKIQDKYNTLVDNVPKRFHMFNPEWGMSNFYHLPTYQAPQNGFVFNGGQSVVGVDVFVTPPFKKWEVFSNEENIRDPIFYWKLTQLSTRDRDWYTSVEGWPNATENGWGLDKFIPLADIKNATKGFLLNDTIKFEVEILSFSKTDFFSD